MLYLQPNQGSGSFREDSIDLALISLYMVCIDNFTTTYYTESSLSKSISHTAMAKRKRNKEKTRNEIVQSAIKIFTKKGFVRGSTEDIAKDCGIAHGTVFYHFPSRSDLIIASIYTAMDEVGTELNESSRNTDNIYKICEIFLDGVQGHAEFYSRLSKDLPLLPEKVQRMVFASLSGFSVHLVEVIERGQKRGKFRKFPPKIAMFYWFGMVNYLYSYEKMLGTKKLSKGDKHQIIEFFVDSIRRQGRRGIKSRS